MCWVKSVGGFVGFGLKVFVICGFQTQWAPWFFFIFFILRLSVFGISI